MRDRRWLTAVLVLAGAALPASVQGADELKWKFEDGKSFYQEITTKTDQTMKISGQSINQTQLQTFYFKWTPKKPKDKNKKDWTIEQEIIGVKMKIEIGGNTISYDSTKADSGQNNPLGEFFKTLIGSKFTLTVDQNMKVTKVEGKDQFIDKLIKANAQMEPLLKEILSDEAIKQMADPAFGALPGKPVKKNDTWEKESTLNMGPIGKYKTTYKYTYDGKKNEKDADATIKVKMDLKYTPPDSKTPAQLPFKIEKATLKPKDANGTIKFDTKNGRIDSSRMMLKLDGTLDIDIGGTKTKVDLDQTQTTTVKTTEKDPLPQKKAGG
jgi:hypothetical protein